MRNFMQLLWHVIQVLAIVYEILAMIFAAFLTKLKRMISSEGNATEWNKGSKVTRAFGKVE